MPQGEDKPMDEQERIRVAAFNITAAWEGDKGYANYQTYDTGLISYGRFQFTLAAGSLARVLDGYLAAATSPVAQQLRVYQQRVDARDASLRTDETFKQLMIEAAAEDEMRDAQDEVVIKSYWNPSQDSVNVRGIVTPVGQALLFDMAIQHGPGNMLIQTAEAFYGAPPKSRLGENGINEQQLISRVAIERRDFLYRLADKQNLPGVKKRGDFWIDLINSKGDWQLQGDGNGNVFVYGQPVQARNPDTGRQHEAPAAQPAAVSQPPATPTQPAAPDEPHPSYSLAGQPEPQGPPPPAPRAQPGQPVAAAPDQPGEPVTGAYVARISLRMREQPSTDSAPVASVLAGARLPVSRRYAPSAQEEWFETAQGWIARLHPSAPGEVFGDFIPG
jgi:hypothetical protein